MSIVVIGVNHRTAPLAVLERLAIAPDDVAKSVAGLAQRDTIREVVVLSTCGRTEVYLVAERFHGAYADVTGFLAALAGMPLDELHPHLLALHDDAAATHLFEVTAGLDSFVLGESEILGQVPRLVEHGGRQRRCRGHTRPAVPSRLAHRQAGSVGDGDRPRHVLDQSCGGRARHRAPRVVGGPPRARRRCR